MAERIVSLLPSATEILWFLGHGHRVVGVTFECNEPAEANTRPQVTDTIIPAGADPAEIDRIIREAVEAGQELYRLDRQLLASLDPDLIVSQDLCRVCAIASGDVNEAVRELGCEAEVFSYDPMTLDQVLDQMAALDRVVTGRSEAEPLATGTIDQLRERLALIEADFANRDPVKVLLLEWVDPPFTPGHWIPDQIARAGGEPLLANAGQRSEASDWETVAGSEAEVLIVAPCGFDLAGAKQQLDTVLARPELASLPAVRNRRAYAIDADAFIVRPGPRLIDGVEALAQLIHP